MKKAVLLVAVMLVASGVVFGQAFKITSVGGALGVHGLLGPEGMTEAASKGGAGMGIGPFLGASAKVRASMASMPSIRWTGRVGFDIFQGSTTGYKYTQNQLGIGLGAEYPLKAMAMGAKQLWPYVGGELQFNLYPEASEDPATAGAKYASGMRIGIGLGGGIEYPINEKLNIDCGLKLSIGNLLLAPASQTFTQAVSSPEVIWLGKPVTATTTSIEEGTLMYISLNIGVNFSLGAVAGGM